MLVRYESHFDFHVTMRGAATGGGNTFDRISSDYECTMVTGSLVGCRFQGGGNRPKQSEPLPNPCNRFTYLFAPTFPASILPPRNLSRDASVTLKLAHYCALEVIRHICHQKEIFNFHLILSLNLLG